MKNVENLNFNLDEYGRVIIEDSELLEIVSGAISNEELGLIELDGACGNNSNCSNQNC